MTVAWKLCDLGSCNSTRKLVLGPLNLLKKIVEKLNVQEIDIGIKPPKFF